MKVWLVEGDDRCYGDGGNWVVGVYLSKEKADEAVKKDTARYKSAVHPSTKYLSYDINEVEVE